MTDKQHQEVEIEVTKAQWLKLLRECCEKGQIAISYENEMFRTAERFFWIGLIAGVGTEKIPLEIQTIIYRNGSPLLEYKPKRTRRSRSKKTETPPPDILK